jgi:hypothetical protein
MRLRVVTLIFSEIIVGFLILAGPAFHDRADLARAVIAYHKTPSPETQTELTRQRQITQQQQRWIFAIFALIFVANSYALVHTVRRVVRVQPGNSQQ